MACVSKENPIVTPPSRLVKGFNPSAMPVINGLSTDTFPVNTYGELIITGKNFFPFGMTYIEYGNTRVDITYNSSSSVTLLLPVELPNIINYNIKYPYTVPIKVINVESKFQHPPIRLISNTVYFTLTEQLNQNDLINMSIVP